MADTDTETPGETSTGPGLVTILLLTAACLVVVIAIAFIIFYCCCLRKTPKRRLKNTPRRTKGSMDLSSPELYDTSKDTDSRVSISTVDESVCYNYRYFCRGENVMPVFADNIWEIVNPKKTKPQNYPYYTERKTANSSHYEKRKPNSSHHDDTTLNRSSSNGQTNQAVDFDEPNGQPET